jgi:protein-disulfide isomerase
MRAMRLAGMVVALAMLVAAACGGDSSDPEGGPTPRPPGTTPTAAAGESELAAALQKLVVPAELADGMFLGKPDAKLTLVMFEDFRCSHCLRFTALVEPTLIEEYVVTGKVRLEFRNWPILGAESVMAALGSECAAEQDRFWEYHKALFIATAKDTPFTEANLMKFADDLRLDAGAFASCYASEATLEKLRANVTVARGAGLTGTPGFMIDGQAIAAAPATVAAWRQFLDQRLAGR